MGSGHVVDFHLQRAAFEGGRKAKIVIPIPHEVRQLLDAPTMSTFPRCERMAHRVTGAAWVGLEDDYILVCTSDEIWKAKDMRRDPHVAMSVTDMASPYRMAAIQGHVIEVRRDEDGRYMDQISLKYTNAPFPVRGPDCVYFVISVEKAAQRKLGFVHLPTDHLGLSRSSSWSPR